MGSELEELLEECNVKQSNTEAHFLGVYHQCVMNVCSVSGFDLNVEFSLQFKTSSSSLFSL